MKRSLATSFVAATMALSYSPAHATSDPQWLKCTLTQDITRDSSGKATTKPLTGSVVFVIDDVEDHFFNYSEQTKAFTELRADIRTKEVTFYDGPLFDTIGRVTGTFSVVQSPFHEAHGKCVPIDAIVKGRPKF